MPRRPLINRTPAVGIVLCHMGRDVHPAKPFDKLLRVVILFPAHCHPLPTLNPLSHQHRCISFRSSFGLGQKSLHQEPVAVFHEYMSQVAQLCLAAFGLLKQPGIGIRRALVGLVLPRLPVKIDIPSRPRRVPLPIFPPETLLTRPCLDQRPQ